MAEVISSELLTDLTEPFGPEELFCLIIAAYVHDVGMTVFEEGEERERFLERCGPAVQEVLRATHPQRSGTFLDLPAATNIVPQSLRSHIANIVLGHGLEPEELFRLHSGSVAVGRQQSNVASLSSVLCCSDLLEFSLTRVLDDAMARATASDDAGAQRSLLEMEKHNSVGCNVALADSVVVMSGTFTSPEALHGTHK
jgi:hypothetical protein